MWVWACLLYHVCQGSHFLDSHYLDACWTNFKTRIFNLDISSSEELSAQNIWHKYHLLSSNLLCPSVSSHRQWLESHFPLLPWWESSSRWQRCYQTGWEQSGRPGGGLPEWPSMHPGSAKVPKFTHEDEDTVMQTIWSLPTHKLFNLLNLATSHWSTPVDHKRHILWDSGKVRGGKEVHEVPVHNLKGNTASD